jgi:hypothetical protein
MVDADEFLKKGMVIVVVNWLIEWVDVLFSTVRWMPSMFACIYFLTWVLVNGCITYFGSFSHRALVLIKSIPREHSFY